MHIEHKVPEVNIDFDKLLSQPDDPGFKAWDDDKVEAKPTSDTPAEEEDDEFLLPDEDGTPAPRQTTKTTDTPQLTELDEIRLLLKQERESNAKFKEELSDLSKWKKEVHDYAHNNLISSKEAERRQAMKDGDIDKAFELEGQIKQIKDAAQAATTVVSTPTKDPLQERVETFVGVHGSALDAKVRRIHTLNVANLEKASESRKRTLLAAFQQAVHEGVANGKSVDEIVSDYADRVGFRTVQPVSRTSSAPTGSSGTGGGGSINARFNALPKDVRKLWTDGGFDRIYGGNLEEYVKESEKSLRS